VLRSGGMHKRAPIFKQRGRHPLEASMREELCHLLPCVGGLYGGGKRGGDGHGGRGLGAHGGTEPHPPPPQLLLAHNVRGGC